MMIMMPGEHKSVQPFWLKSWPTHISMHRPGSCKAVVSSACGELHKWPKIDNDVMLRCNC